MTTKKHLLVVDDDINIVASLQFILADEGFEVTSVTTPEAALAKIGNTNFDCVLMDMNFQQDTTSGAEGIKLVEHIKHLEEQLPIIVMTGWATIDIAVEAMQAGAKDFIQKPWSNERLIAAVNTQLALSYSNKQVGRLSQQNKLLVAAEHPASRQGIIAKSAKMLELLATLEQLAKSDMSILLTGDNGTGKSMLAAYVHQVSARAKHSFVPVNMGAVPESLFESEMFGHVKGAFTDAKDTRIGRFEMAENGTLFLDELANIPLAQQAKLLRVLEEKRYEAVGSSKPKTANVRIISATNSNLLTDIEENRFRQDLYYRLNTVELRVPSLSERVEDIPLLAQHFLEKFSQKYHRPAPQLANDAIEQLCCYGWPGNIRELSHMMERLMFTCKDGKISAATLSLQPSNEIVNFIDDPSLTMEEVEQLVMVNRLKHFSGNASETAKSLGLSRSGYYRRLTKYGMET
ncbi:sigma-54-dependent transcriptional regulator [Thalassotalea marina]|uniref:Sigma-54-dependent Fis family transcriptional regulator n=1 Tax=Thalassotalea marina TaxID=1673741 RepID=A0A919EPR7_9GAMM|nr:sigma-54 dependent transcriptional regulator [Thalassotalea marina]GHG05479.1 sigma-54-dependent Fis family transcriptional regulator [Thalassotalea marina]